MSYNAKEMVREKIRKLPLPELLKKKILDIIGQILVEIIYWVKIRGRFLPLTMLEKAFNNLCWTSEGMVNEKKTAEVLIKDEELDITRRYELACIYCLENDIKQLWIKLSEIEKEYLFYKYATRDCFYTSKLVAHWTLWMKDASGDNAETIKCTTWKYAFEYAVNDANIAAAEYTLQKLTPEERKQFLILTAQNVSNSISHFSIGIYKRYRGKVLIFLLSKMGEQQQMEIFQTCSYVFLNSLLDWPRRNFFLETAERLWDFLPPNDYIILIEDIIDRAFMSTGYPYVELFREIWQRSPIIHQKYAFDNCNIGILMFKLLRNKDKDSIKFILKGASPEEKSKIILCDRGANICVYFMEHEDWDSLKFFILECITSTNDMAKLKENLLNKLSELDGSSNADKMVKLKRVFKLIKEDSRKDDKK